MIFIGGPFIIVSCIVLLAIILILILGKPKVQKPEFGEVKKGWDRTKRFGGKIRSGTKYAGRKGMGAGRWARDKWKARKQKKEQEETERKKEKYERWKTEQKARDIRKEQEKKAQLYALKTKKRLKK